MASLLGVQRLKFRRLYWKCTSTVCVTGDGMDGMKHSPANGPGTPRDDGMGDYSMGGYQDGPPNHVSMTLSMCIVAC